MVMDRHAASRSALLAGARLSLDDHIER